MYVNFSRRKNRRRYVKRIIWTLEMILSAEEFYYNSLSDDPADEDQVIESDYTLSEINDAIDCLRNAY